MKYVLLRIEDDEEARQLLDDMSQFSGAPLRTPGGENEVYATVEGTVTGSLIQTGIVHGGVHLPSR